MSPKFTLRTTEKKGIIALVIVFAVAVAMVWHYWPQKSPPSAISAVMPSDQKFGELVLGNIIGLRTLAQQGQAADTARKADINGLREKNTALQARIATLEQQLTAQVEDQKASPALIQQLQDAKTTIDNLQNMQKKTDDKVSENDIKIKNFGDKLVDLISVSSANAAGLTAAQQALDAKSEDTDRRFGRIDTILAMVRVPPAGSKDAADLKRDVDENAGNTAAQDKKDAEERARTGTLVKTDVPSAKRPPSYVPNNCPAGLKPSGRFGCLKIDW